jgi:hypothetical protein
MSNEEYDLDDTNSVDSLEFNNFKSVLDNLISGATSVQKNGIMTNSQIKTSSNSSDNYISNFEDADDEIIITNSNKADEITSGNTTDVSVVELMNNINGMNTIRLFSLGNMSGSDKIKLFMDDAFDTNDGNKLHDEVFDDNLSLTSDDEEDANGQQTQLSKLLSNTRDRIKEQNETKNVSNDVSNDVSKNVSKNVSNDASNDETMNGSNDETKNRSNEETQNTFNEETQNTFNEETKDASPDENSDGSSEEKPRTIREKQKGPPPSFLKNMALYEKKIEQENIMANGKVKKDNKLPGKNSAASKPRNQKPKVTEKGLVMPTKEKTVVKNDVKPSLNTQIQTKANSLIGGVDYQTKGHNIGGVSSTQNQTQTQIQTQEQNQTSTQMNHQMSPPRILSKAQMQAARLAALNREIHEEVIEEEYHQSNERSDLAKRPVRTQGKPVNSSYQAPPLNQKTINASSIYSTDTQNENDPGESYNEVSQNITTQNVTSQNTASNNRLLDHTQDKQIESYVKQTIAQTMGTNNNGDPMTDEIYSHGEIPISIIRNMKPEEKKRASIAMANANKKTKIPPKYANVIQQNIKEKTLKNVRNINDLRKLKEADGVQISNVQSATMEQIRQLKMQHKAKEREVAKKNQEMIENSRETKIEKIMNDSKMTQLGKLLAINSMSADSRRRRTASKMSAPMVKH